MAEFRVPFETGVTSWVTVEADSLDEAIELAEREGVPGLMHLDHSYPDVGDWEVPDWYIEEQQEEASK